MKKRNFILAMILGIVIMLNAGCVSLAGGNFTTGSASGTGVGNAEPGAWAISTKDFGTRYVFKINGKEIKREYYINHVYDGGKEKVFLGSGIDMMEYHYSGSTYFGFKTSNKGEGNWPGKDQGEPRHVIVWGDYSNPAAKFDFDGFGLNDNNIKLLADTIIEYANLEKGSKKKDPETARLLQRVKDTIDGTDAEGGVIFEIRAEILMDYRIKGTKGTGNTADNPFGIYVTYQCGKHQYLTYNELRALWFKLGGDDSRRHFDRIAMQLYEDDEEYTIFNGHLNCSCNYAAKAGVLFTLMTGDNTSTLKRKYANYLKMNAKFKDFTGKKSDFLRRYIPGFCSIEANYNGKTVYPVLGVQYAKDNKEITVQYFLSDSANNKEYNAANKYYPADLTGKNSTHENSNPASYETIHGFSNCDKPVISEGWDYIYNSLEKHPPVEPDKTTIIINYKDEKTGELIKITGLENPENPTQPGTFTKKDLDSKGYTYTGVEINKPEHSEKNPSATSVTIPDDKKVHEITFWYRSQDVTKIKVIHKIEGNSNDPNDPEIVKEVIEDYILEGGPSKKYTEKSKIYGPGFEYVGVEELQPEKKGKTKIDEPIEIKFSGDTTYEIIFWYKLKTFVKIKGVCESTNTKIYETDERGFYLPLKESFKESSYTSKYPEYFKYTHKYEVKYRTKSYNGKGNIEEGYEVSLDIKKEVDPIQQVLIVFYYESLYSADVEHYYVNPMNNTDIRLIDTDEKCPIIPGEKKTFYSKSLKNNEEIPYINFGYEVVTENGDKVEGIEGTFKKNYRSTYDIWFTPGESNYTIKFYYTLQTVKVIHKKEHEEEPIKSTEKILNPSNTEKSLDGYQLKRIELNGEEEKNNPVKLEVKDGVERQELIFIYKDPELIFDKDKVPKGNPENPDYEAKAKEYKTGIFPNDLYNQLIGQLDNEYYWVLNEKGEITIRLAIAKMDGTDKIECKLKIPFDVYVNNVYKKYDEKESSFITVDCNFLRNDDRNGYTIYEGKLENIYVPIWVPEKTYKISAYAKYTHDSKEIIGEATANVTVVGAVYDFTITNLDGSDTTGDSMWKKSLFPTVTEIEKGYKANKTAIGQGTQQPSKYYQAIKRGTRFYFSLNTLGVANSQIEIVPSFYYVSANGGDLIPVEMTSNYKENERSISLTDKNRETKEFLSERAKKKNVTGTLFKIGDYKTIKLDRNVSTPYLGIKNDIQAKFNNKDIGTILKEASKSEENLYDLANHWYGDYSVPNDATFSVNGKQVDENGYLIVYFSIITRNENGKKYLAYDLDSPFVQTKPAVSEWIHERGSESLKITLPKTNVGDTTTRKTGDIWRIEDKNSPENGHTAVIIYSLKPNVSTKQNVTSAGTH